MWVRALSGADMSCGGKAANLARLIAAGLPVPDGFAIDRGAFAHVAGSLSRELDQLGHAVAQLDVRLELAPVPEDVEREVIARATALGDRVIVRSSAAIEDGENGAAAGVFGSSGPTAPGDVWRAIRAVWASALTPLAIAYARGRDLAIGAIVQRFVPGDRITVYTRPPGAPTRDEAWIQDGELVKRPRSDEVAQLAVAAELAIGAERGADVELIRGDRLWVVQARPIIHPVVAPRVDPPPVVLAALADGRRWTWDVAHNPEPLSVAQAGLVQLVETAGFSPFAMRVCGGYLYTTPRQPPAPTRALDDVVAEIEHLVTTEPSTLASALDAYLAFYRLWACELSSLVAATPNRAEDRRSIVRNTLANPELDETAVRILVGVFAPSWDVATPTFAERPNLLRDAMARARKSAFDPHDLELAWNDLRELDDLWFAKAQWFVRSALLDRARALGIATDEIFWLSLDEASRDLDPIEATRRARAARTAAARAATWRMPVVVGGSSPTTRASLHGVGVGPRVTGRVVRADALAIGPGDVVVCHALLPALAVFVVGCSAIVCETGGLLDHGAALARELGIACVVDCHDATSRLLDGMIVTVDGNAGTVVVNDG
jgi:pyruvate,water dikinase